MKRKPSSSFWNRIGRGKKRRNKEEKEREVPSTVVEGPIRRRHKKNPLSHKKQPSPESLSCSQNSEGPSVRTDGRRCCLGHCNDPACQCRAFEEKHEEGCSIGSGSYGRVYSGLRKEDMLPVAVKHIPLHKVTWATANLDGTLQEVPLEVFLLLIVSGGNPTPKGVIRLLDWYKLQEEVLLVLERPIPSVDLFDFVLQRGGFLQECEAKVILRQLVEAVLEIHGRGVVHRDIKLDNVLVQTDSSGPLVHVLDFGCGAMLNESPHKFHAGTCLHMPPECYLRSEFHAVPSTVWQLGIVLYQMLTQILPFSTPKEIIYQELYLWQELTSECKDLLQRCLDKRLRVRPTVEEILQHAWFHLEVRSDRHNQESEVYFIKQTVGNSCGTLGQLHAVANNKHTGLEFGQQAGTESLDCNLSKFLDDTASLSTDDRAKHLETNQAASVICWQFMKREKIEVHFSPVALCRLWPEPGGGHWMTGPSYK